MINRVSAELTQQQVNDALNAINTIKQALPFLINLTSQERSALPKMDDNRRPFVEKALEYGKSDEDMLPRYIDLDELDRDLSLFKELSRIGRELNKLDESIKDTLAAVGSESYVAALSVYNAAKMATRSGTKGIDTVVDDLKRQFYQERSNNSDE